MEFEKLAKIIAEVMNMDPKEIKPDTAFAEDLGADSLDVYRMILGIEEALEIEISADDAEKVATVKDAMQLIDRMVG